MVRAPIVFFTLKVASNQNLSWQQTFKKTLYQKFFLNEKNVNSPTAG
jgi:hypothetical protein